MYRREFGLQRGDSLLTFQRACSPETSNLPCDRRVFREGLQGPCNLVTRPPILPTHQHYSCTTPPPTGGVRVLGIRYVIDVIFSESFVIFTTVFDGSSSSTPIPHRVGLIDYSIKFKSHTFDSFSRENST